MKRFTPLAVITLTIFALQGSNAQCTEKDERYPLKGQCDGYIQCVDGAPEKKLCPDGLLFKEATSECVYAPSITCGARGKLQPPNGTDNCPRQFGFYRVGDASHCGQYMNCHHGYGKLVTCPEGLAFNKDNYRCDWADEAADCDAEAFLGFTCPPKDPTNPEEGEEDEFVLKYYPHPNDCNHYFVCVKGRPRLYTCARFLSFNKDTKSCGTYNDVPGCKIEHTPEYPDFLESERLREENEKILAENARRLKEDNEKLLAEGGTTEEFLEGVPTEGVPTEDVPTEGVPTEDVPTEGVEQSKETNEKVMESVHLVE